MASATRQQLLRYIELLMEIGENARSDALMHPNPFETIHPQPSGEFFGGCRHLRSLLGPHAGPWASILEAEDKEHLDDVSYLIGTLTSIRNALSADLLVTIEQLVDAETFTDLLDQAEHLHGQQYDIPAGVLGRAVLEEHLRKLCAREKVSPAKQNATINDYNMALYNATPPRINKVAMQHIAAMAAIGNDAAHGKAVKHEDVERLLRDVRMFLALHP